LPKFKGSTFRGPFGHSLKKVACSTGQKDCVECILNSHCIYTKVFESKVHSNDRHDNFLPHPYVIEPPETTKTVFMPGDNFTFNLLLFGEINQQLPYLIYAFQKMGVMGIGKKISGKRAQFIIKQVTCDEKVVYSGESGQMVTNNYTKNELTFTAETIAESNRDKHLKIDFITPLRIKFQNRFVPEVPFPFHVLVRAMLRRMSSLMEKYGGGKPEINYQEIVARAEEIKIAESNLNWQEITRYSSRQESKMLIGGLMGNITYQGKLAEYIKLIDFCRHTHLGKQTSFGLGKISYQVF